MTFLLALLISTLAVYYPKIAMFLGGTLFTFLAVPIVYSHFGGGFIIAVLAMIAVLECLLRWEKKQNRS